MQLFIHSFVEKWQESQLKEISSSQEHFIDLCHLVGHPTPAKADPKGEFFTFERQVSKTTGRLGRADVWKKGCFAWEYKGKHGDLDKAYQQLLQYRESLENPPLLIVCDIKTIVIHTNFTNTVKQTHTIDFERLLEGDGLDLLERVFHDPEWFKPKQTRQQLTEATAEAFVEIADILREWARLSNRQHDSERLAHFMVRLFFCLFAESLGMLPDRLFTRTVEIEGNQYTNNFVMSLRHLFTAMRDGTVYGFQPIPHFDGGLFDDDFVPENLSSDIKVALKAACRRNWANIDPTIFGTLFERVIDESKRRQLGAHYTSQDDILLIVEPVLMRPYREKWRAVRREVRQILGSQPLPLPTKGKRGEIIRPEITPAGTEANAKLQQFATEIADLRVLDPACGSGNFLYVALQQLLDLQKEVITFAHEYNMAEISLTVHPRQLYGIELNPYAHELAQVTVWIGYIQWRYENGLTGLPKPILEPLENIKRMDAILAFDKQNQPVEPAWPEAEVVIGNPPFLGGQVMLSELGESYVTSLRKLYQGRVDGGADLVTYWFEKARKSIEEKHLKRAGLLATQAIRAGAGRHMLERIKSTGDIFYAQSDRPWVLCGASVRISMVGFDDGSEQNKLLNTNLKDPSELALRNAVLVKTINANLTTNLDITQAQRLTENQQLSFQGPVKVGSFDIENSVAQTMLNQNNPGRVSNADVIKPWMNGSDIARRSRNMWIIDFGELSLEQAKLYQAPFNYVREYVRPFRDKNRNKHRREYWWQLGASGKNYKSAKQGLQRVIVTPRVSKYRLFIWADAELVPDSRLFAFVREDDCFFGMLHSKIHEIWSLATASWHGVGNDPTYNSTTCFETFPFPWPPGQEPAESENERVLDIAEAARQLDALRVNWLNPTEEALKTRLNAKQLKKMTLTNLYNALELYRTRPHWSYNDWGDGIVKTLKLRDMDKILTLDLVEQLHDIHAQLDQAVLRAYGWPETLSDDEILSRLLALNLQRCAKTDT